MMKTQDATKEYGITFDVISKSDGSGFHFHSLSSKIFGKPCQDGFFPRRLISISKIGNQRDFILHSVKETYAIYNQLSSNATLMIINQ